jgi:hypothetical protein
LEFGKNIFEGYKCKRMHCNVHPCVAENHLATKQRNGPLKSLALGSSKDATIQLS